MHPLLSGYPKIGKITMESQKNPNPQHPKSHEFDPNENGVCKKCGWWDPNGNICPECGRTWEEHEFEKSIILAMIEALRAAWNIGKSKNKLDEDFPNSHLN